MLQFRKQNRKKTLHKGKMFFVSQCENEPRNEQGKKRDKLKKFKY